MNNSNLIPNSKRTPEQLREMGRKGGIKSGESRRKKRKLKIIARMIMEEFPPGDLLAGIGAVRHDK